MSIRITYKIKCPSCLESDAFERRNTEKQWELFCPDCKEIFAWDHLPTKCECGSPLRLPEEKARWLCPSCFLKTWSPQKKRAFNKLVSMAFKTPKPSEEEKEAAVDEAFKHVRD